MDDKTDTDVRPGCSCDYCRAARDNPKLYRAWRAIKPIVDAFLEFDTKAQDLLTVARETTPGNWFADYGGRKLDLHLSDYKCDLSVTFGELYELGECQGE